MKPEYEAIAKKWQSVLGGVSYHVASAVAECEALAKPRELTEAECMEIWRAFEKESEVVASVRVMVAKADEIRAHPAEPEPVEFDYDKWSKGGWQAQYHAADEWVNTDKICLGYNYRMRRKP